MTTVLTTRRIRVAGALLGILAVALAAVLLTGRHTSAKGDAAASERQFPAAWGRTAVDSAGLVQRSGVTVTRVAITGDGGLLDLRYRVIDPARANALHDQATPPAVIDEQSGLVVHQLFMDHSHSGPYQVGITYYLVFNNPSNWVHRGSKVTVLLGDAQLEHLVVR